MKVLPILLFSAIAAQAADPAAAGMNAARLALIPARMREYVDAGKTAGVVTLVARHGHLAALDAVGYQDLEAKTPMRADSIFRIASMTKPVTCAAIMILVDDGRVSLLDPVEKYLPEFKGLKLGQKAPARPPTILDLATHTSGLPSTATPAGAKPATLAEAVGYVSTSSLLFEPGTEWKYSNVGIAALGRIVEVVAKQPYDQFLSERIFRPLNMRDTTFKVPDEKSSRVAVVYTYESTGLKRANLQPSRYPAPEGGLFSTVSDMARFHQLILNKGTLDGKRILSAAAVDSIITSYTGTLKAGVAPGAGHGLGFEVIREALGTYRYTSIGSFVKGGAYRTYGFGDPAKDLMGIIFMQRTNGGGDEADEINSFLAMAAAAIEK